MSVLNHLNSLKNVDSNAKLCAAEYDILKIAGTRTIDGLIDNATTKKARVHLYNEARNGKFLTAAEAISAVSGE